MYGQGGRGRSQSSGGFPSNYNPNFNADYNNAQRQNKNQQRPAWQPQPRPQQSRVSQQYQPATTKSYENFAENSYGNNSTGSIGMYHRRPESSASREQLQDPYEQQEYGRNVSQTQQNYLAASFSTGGSMAEPRRDASSSQQETIHSTQPAIPLGDPVATAAAAAAVLRGDTAAGAQFVESQGLQLMSRWMPGFAAFWARLRSYFAVSHRYTLLKLRALLVPWTKKVWRRKRLASNVPTSPPGGGGTAAGRPVSGEPIRYALPIDDDNAPDLYIPLVAFLTFALVTGYVKGTSGKFTPQVLAQIVSNCALFQVFELAFYSAGLYASGATIPSLDIAVHTGYKYVALCVNLLFGLLFGLRAYYCSLAYTALSASYYMLKTMAQTVPTKQRAVGPKREVVVILLGAIQGISIWFLGYNREL